MISTEAAGIGRQRVLDALAALWRAIQQRHEEVPNVLLTWESGGRRGRTTGLLHLHSGPWADELVITDELMAREPSKLISAVLHDAGHGLAAARGIADTSNNGRYHNRSYAEVAGELGLNVAEHTDYARWGWSETQPTGPTLAHYEAELANLRDAVEQYVPAAPSTPAVRGRNNVVAICGCTGTAARPLRIAPKKLQLGPITCGVCGEPFRERAETVD
jgi:hypothetical protein